MGALIVYYWPWTLMLMLMMRMMWQHENVYIVSREQKMHMKLYVDQ